MDERMAFLFKQHQRQQQLEQLREELKNEIVNMKIEDIDFSKFDKGLDIPYHHFVLSAAAEVGSRELVQQMIKEYGVNVNETLVNEKMAIHFAVEGGQLQMVEFLLQLGADIECLMIDSDNYPCTPLKLAVQRGRENIIDFLIKRGANIKCSGRADGKPPLEEAVEHCSERIINTFLNFGCCIETLEEALSEACNHNRLHIVTLLLDHVMKVDAGIIDRTSALENAAHSGHKEIVKLLLDRGADIERAGSMSEGWETALHMAASSGHVDVLRLLLDNGADIANGDINGNTALHIAAGNGRIDALRFLLKRLPDFVNHKNAEDGTPLLAAVEIAYKNEEIFKQFIPCSDNINDVADKAVCNIEKIVKLLLDHGADINIENREGDTIISWLISYIKENRDKKKMKLVKFFIMHIVKMRCDGLFVSEWNWLASSRKGNSKLSKFQQDFEKELKVMNTCKFTFTDLQLCFSDVLKVKNDKELLALATNVEVTNMLRSSEFKSRFPIFQRVITKRFKDALKEKEWLNQFQLFFSHLADREENKLPKLVQVCIYNIESYLGTEDKKNVLSIVKVVIHSA